MNSGLKIILVDDSPIVNKRLQNLLSERIPGSSIACAESYKDAVVLISSTPADCAVIDINLNGNNGIDLLRMIKDHKFSIKIIIMMTADPTEEKKQICLDLGADLFISKYEEIDDIPVHILKMFS